MKTTCQITLYYENDATKDRDGLSIYAQDGMVCLDDGMGSHFRVWGEDLKIALNKVLNDKKE